MDNKKHYKAIFFDMDGTLCDTFDDIYSTLSYAIEKQKLPMPNKPTIKSFIGSGLRSLITQTLTYIGNLNPFEEVVEDFLSYYREHPVDKSKPYEGFEEVLEALQNKNILMGVISNKSEELVKMILKRLNIDKFFELAYGGDSFAERKPDPAPILNALKALSISANKDDALIVGDSDFDILAGNSANISTCYVTYGFAKLQKSSPDFIINKPCELLNYIY